VGFIGRSREKLEGKGIREYEIGMRNQEKLNPAVLSGMRGLAVPFD
jgi:hypothetical protein